MLPEALFGTYCRYKENTTKFAAKFTTWLSKAAIKCGFDATKISGSAQPSGTSNAHQETRTPRLKGCARKLAREAAAAKAKRVESPQANKSNNSKLGYGVVSKELLAQAKLVASCLDLKVSLPQAMINLVQGAIEARQKCSMWFENSGKGDDVSNRSHVKFTDILKEIVKILTSATVTEVTSRHQLTKSTRSRNRQASENRGSDGDYGRIP